MYTIEFIFRIAFVLVSEAKLYRYIEIPETVVKNYCGYLLSNYSFSVDEPNSKFSFVTQVQCVSTKTAENNYTHTHDLYMSEVMITVLF